MSDFLTAVATDLDREPDPWGVHVRDCDDCFDGAPCSLERTAWAARLARRERARAAVACPCSEEPS